MLKLGNYDGIKELLKTTQSQNNISVEVSKICELGLGYLRHILDINFDLNENEIVFPEHFIQEWHFELEAYKACLEDCIRIIDSNIALDSFLKELDERIDEEKANLYPGFLTSESAVKEVSISYNTMLEFKNSLERLQNVR